MLNNIYTENGGTDFFSFSQKLRVGGAGVTFKDHAQQGEGLPVYFVVKQTTVIFATSCEPVTSSSHYAAKIQLTKKNNSTFSGTLTFHRRCICTNTFNSVLYSTHDIRLHILHTYIFPFFIG